MEFSRCIYTLLLHSKLYIHIIRVYSLNDLTRNRVDEASKHKEDDHSEDTNTPKASGQSISDLKSFIN